MIDESVRARLHEDLRDVRGSILSSLDGLTEYEIRRPMTRTGTNLLGLIKHVTLSEAVYLGDVLGRPFPEPHPRFEDPGFRNRDWLWVSEQESRADVVATYGRACLHADETIETLPMTAGGHVPWWPRPDVRLFDVLVHVLTETNRHSGHADILREALEDSADHRNGTGDIDDWAAHVARIDRAAQHFRGPDH